MVKPRVRAARARTAKNREPASAGCRVPVHTCRRRSWSESPSRRRPTGGVGSNLSARKVLRDALEQSNHGCRRPRPYGVISLIGTKDSRQAAVEQRLGEAEQKNSLIAKRNADPAPADPNLTISGQIGTISAHPFRPSLAVPLVRPSPPRRQPPSCARPSRARPASPPSRLDRMKMPFAAALLLGVLAIPGSLLAQAAANPAGPGIDPGTGWILHQAAHPNPSKAYHWMHVMQEASGRSVDRVGARPTIISREMHVVVTAMYDAWAAYDAKAVRSDE